MLAAEEAGPLPGPVLHPSLSSPNATIKRHYHVQLYGSE
jgi:hypothetical protein